MKVSNFLVKYRPEIEKIHIYLTIALAFLLAFYREIIPKVIFIWILSWLLTGNFRNKFSNLQNKLIFFIIISFYLLFVFGMIYTENIDSGLFDLTVKLPLFLFPFVVISSKELYKNKMKTILGSFVAGNIIASVICLIVALYHSVGFDGNHIFFNAAILDKNFTFWKSIIYGGNYFFYSDLSAFHVHPAYFSMYIIFCIVILFSFFEDATKKQKLLLSSIILVFSIMIFLLSSRAGIIIGALVIITNILILILKKTKLIPRIFTIAFLFTLVFIAITVNPRFSTFPETIKSYKEYFSDHKNRDNLEYNDSRVLIWITSAEIIKENFFIGVGTGDVKNSLLEKYKQKKLNSILNQSLNAHNQFVQTFISIGILGFLALLAMFVIPFYLCIKHRKYIYLFFLIICFINFLFESMLETQAGVVFFAFFYTILFADLLSEKTKNQSVLP